MYKCDVTCSLPSPPPVTDCHTFSDPLPLERDVLYGRPIPALDLHPSQPLNLLFFSIKRLLAYYTNRKT